MADERIKDFTGTESTAGVLSRINTLYVALDDTSYSDAKKILWKNLIYSEVLGDEEGSEDWAHVAMTPVCFTNSNATTSLYGTCKLASDSDVTNKNGNNVLATHDQVGMQAQWHKDWHESGYAASEPVIINADDLEDPAALTWNVMWSGNLGSVGKKVSPTFAAPARLEAISVQFSIVQGTNRNSGFISMQFDGTLQQTHLLVTGNIYLNFLADGSSIQVTRGSGTTDVKLAMSFTAVASID